MAKKSIKSLDDVQAPILEETTFDTTQFKKKSLDDIQAPVLTDTTGGNVIQNKKISLDDIQAPILEDTSQHQMVTNVKKSLDDVAVTTLSTTDGKQVQANRVNVVSKEQTTIKKSDTVSNVKSSVNKLEGVSAPIVEQPQQEERYVSKYANADIERAKQEGLKQAHKVSTPELTEEEKQKSREARRKLQAMQEQEMAKKGGKTVILLLFLGLFATIGFHLLITLPEFKEGGSSLVEKLKSYIIYYDVLLALGSFLMLPKLEGFKKFSSVVFGLNLVVTITLGSFLLTQMAGIGINIVFYIISLVCSAVISFQLSGNENVGKYYSSMKK